MSKIDSISNAILQTLAEDFGARQLSAADLKTGYEGVVMGQLRTACDEGSPVDFDLALEALTKRKVVRTGPMVPYENTPGSGMVILAMYSRKEWANLTVEGYKKAQQSSAPQPTSSGSQRVQISGSTFVNSPFGVGTAIHQAATLNVTNEHEAFERLYSLAKDISGESGPELKSDVRELVELASAGDLAKAKPLYQRLFGFAANGVQQVAWGVVSSLVSAHLGLPSAPPS